MWRSEADSPCREEVALNTRGRSTRLARASNRLDVEAGSSLFPSLSPAMPAAPQPSQIERTATPYYFLSNPPRPLPSRSRVGAATDFPSPSSLYLTVGHGPFQPIAPPDSPTTPVTPIDGQEFLVLGAATLPGPTYILYGRMTRASPPALPARPLSAPWPLALCFRARQCRQGTICCQG